ncbi:odorant receptor 30a-like [Anthonomus grandis grandis]|uniref:odorant receptor 30a-like n=1 Tax=Anthonomus grandis grandis TaxID=2921223 RepID=UPI00216580B7|nr:odorant receptor 30a-like [Anthonomus grandis grandis]
MRINSLKSSRELESVSNIPNYPKSAFLRMSLICCATMGIFPHQFIFQNHQIRQTCYNIYSKTCFGYMILFILACYLELIVIVTSDQINFTELFKNLIITPLCTITLIRICLVWSQGFRRLINNIINSEESMEGEEQVKKIERIFIKEINKNIKFYLFIMVSTEISYSMRPFFENEEQVVVDNNTYLVRSLPLSTWFPFDARKNFVKAYVIQVIDIFFASCYDSYSEFLLVSVLAYPIVRLKVLQHVFQHFDTYKLKSMESDGVEDPELGSVLFMKKCVRWHLSIIRYIDEFNRIMSTCMFLDFSQSSIHMACVLVETVMVPTTCFKLFSVALYILILNFRLYLYYYYANEVIILSEGLSAAIYQSNWYDEPREVKYMMGIMVMRNQKPLYYKLGGFGPMSLQVFLSILKAAYSYVMLVSRQMD